MKQHITTEDLNQLTEEQKEKLREWWEPTEGDWISYYQVTKPGTHDINSNRGMLLHKDNDEGGWVGDSYGHRIGDDIKNVKLNYYPLLSIGQMIEFLGRDLEILEGLGWSVGYNLQNEIGYVAQELCDALWQAVKSKLEELTK